jgi:periplasmic divalent cation tolerance protein
MKPSGFDIVLVTAPDLETARSLARAAVEARAAACVNLVPNLESYFWWEGEIDHSAEVLMVMKTAAEKVAELEALILARHPYDTPEFLVLPVSAGNQRYLDWLGATLRPPKAEKKAHDSP